MHNVIMEDENDTDVHWQVFLFKEILHIVDKISISIVISDLIQLLQNKTMIQNSNNNKLNSEGGHHLMTSSSGIECFESIHEQI